MSKIVFRLDPDSLSHEELDYELFIREASMRGTLRTKAIQLRKLMAKEEKPPVGPVGSKQEFTECVEKLRIFQAELKEALEYGNTLACHHAKSRIKHYMDRAERAATLDTSLGEIIDNLAESINLTARQSPTSRQQSRPSSAMGRGLLASVGAGRGRMSMSREAIGSMESLRMNLNGNNLATGIDRDVMGVHNESLPEMNRRPEGIRDRYTENTSASGMERQTRGDEYQAMKAGFMPQAMLMKNPSIEKWPVRYSSEDGVSLTDFLWRMDMYAKAERVQKEELFRCMFKLLSGTALEWYEVNADNFLNFNDLVRAMKSRFLPIHYDFMMREEILARIQQPQETAALYLTHMTKLFRKIYPPLDEDYKLYVLQRNMTPQYSLHLSTMQLNSVEQLMLMCKKIDESKLLEMRRKQTPTITKPLEPSCFPPATRNRVNEVEHQLEKLSIHEEMGQSQSRMPNGNRRTSQWRNTNGNQRKPHKNIKCWNCQAVGHSHFDCRQPREKLYCWACGKEGVTVTNCPSNHHGARSMFLNAPRIPSPVARPENQDQSS